jgi:hypothetical protein
MSRYCRYIPVRHVRPIGHLLATLAAAPALILSPLTAQAIVIHNHHGHETHAHTLTYHDLDDCRENPEHQHEEHEHDRKPTDPAEDESGSILVLLGLPPALARARGLAIGAVVSTGMAATARALTVSNNTGEDGRSLVESRGSPAPPGRAHRLVASILLTSHALLL